MSNGKYIDIRISGDDIALDAGGMPVAVADRDSIAQDIVHMIRETGLLVQLVGNRDARTKARNLMLLTLEVDRDERIIPGTTEIEEVGLGQFNLTAQTREFGSIALSLEADSV
ncbi:DUF2590 family protein [Desulfovibrio psychrotolerans]|uniref:Phage protein n=1 Tax=Desulfovibrio psychrotolerans TaxID=415242 RepID=A0A7J0BVM4_9BACT|nr:DUF2590 family protein [Desulfovibrio psychrotolerans]GFM37728.1 hypothetical protein DSM19430T_24120 [Desulfovibrio psychrotolerans]